jgi:MYXO-CTERM domain-containing protein
MLRTTFFLVLFSLALASAASAQRCVDPADSADNPAQNRFCGAPLLDGFGGTAGFGDDTSCMRQNDDGSSPAIDITPYFPSGLRFFTEIHNQIVVNSNGNISFSGPVPNFTPQPFPIADNPMIAPFWADVDIRSADGTCTEPQLLSCRNALGAVIPCAPCQPFASNQIWWHLEEGRAIFTWDEVGHYACRTDRRNSFQLIIEAVQLCGGSFGDFNVEFRYNRCEWDTGDASGGSGGFALTTTRTCTTDVDCRARGRMPPGVCRSGVCVGIAGQAGFDAGNLTDFVEIMGSRNTREINQRLCEESNVGEPGVWRFQLREGAILCPDAGMPCETGMVGACEGGVISCECVGDTCTTSCVPQVAARSEVCNSIDDDCDGMTDEEDGDPLCPAFETCDEGTCIAGCFEGGCADGETCIENVGCVETACVDTSVDPPQPISCPNAGERCRGGVCESPCAGVVCPAPLICAEGACIDQCAEIGCDECTSCIAGLCELRCDRGGSCGAGEACDIVTGHCIDANCVDVECVGAEYCDNGTCIDPCVGAICPEGLVCTDGQCLEPVIVDAGIPPLPDAGMIIRTDAAAPFDAGSGLIEADAGPRVEEGGCGCRTTGSPSGVASLAWLVPLALVFLRRRRGR